ncbi:MAG: folylpolyglutamate synthase/dihydrofolate synthase family protein [Lachnospiraceae bacterium]|jgi:dihydrofolate synthase/folylpolyglutamate synthase|nr:folylpolyglutamate synthase/dihydrofolate synthase family protein [Lachnospiraceae bacterium]MEE3461056.1 folylpolyglutamate synthase/dihydrofolate synthase family protein [Lachnospiraceae bacterium]
MTRDEADVFFEELRKESGSIYVTDYVAELAHRLGDPQNRLKVIHIAGTNGKGSVGTFICDILAMSGYKVGRFSSPAVFDRNETIQKICRVNYKLHIENISDETYADGITAIENICQSMVKDGLKHPTPFEMETVLAYSTFLKWNVDIAVIEAGMGGRFDATNIIDKPVLSVLTNIGSDHMDVLGDSLTKIAEHKAGIIKPGAPAVSALQVPEVKRVLSDTAKSCGSHISYVVKKEITDVSYTMDGTDFTYRGTSRHIKLKGTYQVMNACLALEAVSLLQEQGFARIREEGIDQGLETAQWHGRFEIIGHDPAVIVDGAHNPPGIKVLIESLKKYFPDEKFTIVIGAFKDKDYATNVKLLLPFARKFYTITAPGPRGLNSGIFKNIIEKLAGGKIPVENADNVSKAKEAIEYNKDQGPVLVCGSLSFLKDLYDNVLFIHD